MGHLTMSEKELHRKALMEMVRQGKLKLNQAAVQCGLSFRQAKRVWRVDQGISASASRK